MCGEFGEVTVIIGLVINFLAFVSPLCAFRDTSSYVLCRLIRDTAYLLVVSAAYADPRPT